MRNTQREREAQRHRQSWRSRLHAGSPIRDSIPGLQDQALGRRQTFNCRATQVSLPLLFLIYVHQNSLTEIADWVYTILDSSINLQNKLLKYLYFMCSLEY